MTQGENIYICIFLGRPLVKFHCKCAHTQVCATSTSRWFKWCSHGIRVGGSYGQADKYFSRQDFVGSYYNLGCAWRNAAPYAEETMRKDELKTNRARIIHYCCCTNSRTTVDRVKQLLG